MEDYSRTNEWMPYSWSFAIGISMVVLVFLGLYISRSSLEFNKLSSRNTIVERPEVGSIAPNFELISVAGDYIRLSELQGKMVILNFWATWCAPCILEMPNFQNVHEQYKSELAVVAVNAGESRQVVDAFVGELDLNINILLDPGRDVEKLYYLRGYPTTFFIDSEGVVQVKHIGLLTEGQLTGYLRQVGITD